MNINGANYFDSFRTLRADKFSAGLREKLQGDEMDLSATKPAENTFHRYFAAHQREIADAEIVA